MKRLFFKRFIAVLATMSIVLCPFASAFPVLAEDSDDNWYDASDLRAVQVNESEVVLLVYVRSSFERLKLTFPADGGFRLCSENQGLFSPDALQKIKTESVQNGTKYYGSSKNDVSVVINRGTTPWKMEIYGSDGLLTAFSGEQICFKKTENTIKEVRLKGNIKQDELMYGMGELFDSFYLNGTVHTLWNSDSWSDEESMYKSIPILHSTDGYMLFFNSTYSAVADIGASKDNNYDLYFKGPVFDFYFWAGEPADNISSYTKLTGTPALQPKWAFSYWGGATSSQWEASGKENACNLLKEKLAGYKKLGITKLAAMYGEDTLDNLPEAYTLLAENNTKMLGWCNPFLTLENYASITPELSSDVKSNALPRLKTADGSAYHSNDVIDYTHENSGYVISKLWQDKIDSGLRGLMVDYCEYVPTDSLASNGMTGIQLHNFYTYYYSKQMYDIFNNSCNNDFILFARSAAPGSQKWAANFGGDQAGDFKGLRKAVNALLTFSTCGFSTWGTDIGGLATGNDPELYMRWMQFGAMNPLMRLHGTGNCDPWYYGETAEDSFVNYYWLRENLLNKIYSSSVYANITGKPMCQSMAVAFPKQKALSGATEQYLFCDDFLVCPVTEKGVYSLEVQFPNGNWVDLWTGEVINGGSSVEVDAPLDRSPLYIRSGSAIPVTVSSETLSLATNFDENNKTEALLVTAPNGTRESDYYASVDSKTTYTVSATGKNTFEVYSSNDCNNQRVIMLYGINAEAVSIDGKPLEETASLKANTEKSVYYVDGSLRTVVMVADGEWNKLSVTVGGSKNYNLVQNAVISSNGVENSQFTEDSFAETVATVYSNSYITVDFAEECNIGDVFVKWSESHPDSYNIKLSDDGINWSVLKSVTDCTGMVEHFNFSGLTARYICLDGFAANDSSSFDLYQLAVYSDDASDNLPDLSDYIEYSVSFTEKSKSITLSAEEIKSAVDVYGSSAASNDGLSKVSFDDRFGLVDGWGLEHIIDELGNCQDRWTAQDEVVSSALYNAKQFRNFELTLRLRNRTGVWDVLPRIIFGVQCPGQWINTQGGGYTVGIFNEGNSFIKGVFNGEFSSASDNTRYSDIGKFYNFGAQWYDLTVRVDGNTVTVTVQQSELEAYAYTYELEELGSSYSGGYIGFVFGSGVTNIDKMTVTDLGGKSLTDVSVYFNSAQSAEAVFDVYSGTAAKIDGLYKSSFGDKFTVVDNTATHKFDTSVITDYWQQQDDYITTALYNVKQYRNFEMQVNCCGKENNVGYYWPMLVFGVQDPTCWVNQNSGGYATGVYNEGRSFLKGCVNGSYIIQGDPNVHKNTDGTGYFEAAWFSYTLKLRVTGHKATVTVIPLYDWGSPFSYSYDLGNCYKGGYVGFASTGQNCFFWNFSITDLGGEVFSDAYTRLNNLQQDSALFDVYTGNDAKRQGLQSCSMDSVFSDCENGIIHDFDISSVTDWWEERDSYITTALYNQHKYRNFEIQVTCSGADNALSGYYPMLVFGVQNPFTWMSGTDAGFAACVYQNGSIGLKGYVNGTETDITDLIDRTDILNRKEIGYFPGQVQQYILKVRVEGYKATVTVIPKNESGTSFSAVFYLGKDYRGGFVGFASTGQNCTFSDFSVKDLGDRAYLDFCPCDLNRDGLVFADDLALLRKKLLNSESRAFLPESDTNFDGKNNIIDLIVLKKYFSDLY